MGEVADVSFQKCGDGPIRVVVVCDPASSDGGQGTGQQTVISDDDRRELGDLAMRALDTIIEDYGEDAELLAASLVFEVKSLDEDGDEVFHGNYKSLERNSPHHISGLLRCAADWIAS